MEITFIKIGKPALEVRPLVEMYLKRLSSFIGVQSLEWKDEKPAALISKLEKVMKPGHRLIFLDEKGKTFETKALAKEIQKCIDDPGIKGLVFAIGGPFGFDPELKKKAHALWNLSSLTLQGDLAWLILTEQIYRAFTILKNIDYHH